MPVRWKHWSVRSRTIRTGVLLDLAEPRSFMAWMLKRTTGSPADVAARYELPRIASLLLRRPYRRYSLNGGQNPCNAKTPSQITTGPCG